jgi:hypothetical protein
MHGTRINFKDLYGGTSNVRVMYDDFESVNGAIEDFFVNQVDPDGIKEAKAETAASKFLVYVRRSPIGYRAEINSVEPTSRVVDVDLMSGTITSTIGVQPSPEIPDIRLPKEAVGGNVNMSKDLEGISNVPLTPSEPSKNGYKPVVPAPVATAESNMFSPQGINGFINQNLPVQEQVEEVI